MRKLFIFALLALFIAVPAVAQDAAIEVSTGAENYPIIDPAAAVATIFNAVSGLVLAAFGGAPITVVIVALLKKVSALDRFTVPTLTFATAAVLYVLAILASVTGFQVQFESFLQFLTVAAPAVVSFIGTLIGAPAIYQVAKKNDVAVIGQTRDSVYTTWVN